MAKTESSKVNTLVFEHLSKVAPDIAHIFRRTHPCDESEISASLPQLVSHYKTVTLANALVYKYVNQNYPQLSPHFNLEYVACDFTLEDVVDSNDINQDDGDSHDTNQNDGDSHDTNVKRKRDESYSRRVKHKTDTVNVIPEQDTVDSQFLSELEKYYPCTFPSESSSDSEDSCEIVFFNVKSQTKLKGNESNQVSSSDSEDSCKIISCNVKSLTNSGENKSKQVSNKKSLQNIEKDDIVGFCGILDCDVYKNLLSNWKVDEHSKPLDILSFFILKENILVRKLHQLVKTIGWKTLAMDLSRSVGSTRKADIKLGHLNPAEITLIKRNWKKLLIKCEMGDPLQVFRDIIEQPGSKRSHEDGLKQNVIGLYLSLEMTKVRYASDVFQQAKGIFIKQTRKKHQPLTPQEQSLMMEYVEKHGENCDWMELGYILYSDYERRPSEIKNLYKTLKNKGKVGQFTLLEDKLIIDTIMFDSKTNISDPKFVESVESLETLEKQLGRRKKLISNHWHRILKPYLLQFHTGTLNLNIKRIFFNYLNEKQVLYLQDIEWSELFQQPAFAGQTRRNLTALLNNAQVILSKAKNCAISEITVPMIAEYINERQNPQNMNYNTLLNGRKEKRQTEIINHYKTVMNKIKDSN